MALDLLDKEMPELLRLEIPGAAKLKNLSSNCQCHSHIPCDGNPWVLIGICNWSDAPASHYIPASNLRLAQLSYSAAMGSEQQHVTRLHIIDFFKEVCLYSFVVSFILL